MNARTADESIRLARILVKLSDARVTFRSLVGPDNYEARMKTPRDIIRGAMVKHSCHAGVALTHVLKELKERFPDENPTTVISLMAATLDIMESEK